MERTAEIGSSIFIKGHLTAHEDIVVSGRVEGSITVVGHTVSVKAGAQLVADIQARAIDVSGQVLGTLCADERIDLRETADVEGELSAPALRLESGAGFHGKAETTQRSAKADLQRAS
jgi:cytoskeletal protein CcmA (bactofilin family)